MRRCALTLAVLAAASLPSFALANDAKEQTQNGPVSNGAVQLSDADLDKVTAGLYFSNYNRTVSNPGQGHAYGIGRGRAANGRCAGC